MKILLLGGSGQLGKTLLVSSFIEKNQVVAPSSKDLDVVDLEKTSQYIRNFAPDFVINAAAWTDVVGAEDNFTQAMAVNCVAVGNIALACKSLGSTLIHISTDYVFDGQSGTQYKESDSPNPINNYGKSKLAGEIALQESGISDFYIVRTSWLYSEFGRNFVKTILARAINGEEVFITDDQYGSPTFAGDLADSIEALVVSRPTAGIYHYSNTGIISWKDFGREIYRLAGADEDLVKSRVSFQDGLKRPEFSSLNLNKWQSTGIVDLAEWKDSLNSAFPNIVRALKGEGY